MNYPKEKLSISHPLVAHDRSEITIVTNNVNPPSGGGILHYPTLFDKQTKKHIQYRGGGKLRKTPDGRVAYTFIDPFEIDFKDQTNPLLSQWEDKEIIIYM